MSSAQLRIISLPEVLFQTSISKTSVYTLPDFPKPIKIGGASARSQGGARWVEAEVQAWIQSKIDQRAGVSA